MKNGLILFLFSVGLLNAANELTTKEVRAPSAAVFDITNNTTISTGAETTIAKTPVSVAYIWGYKDRANTIESCQTDQHSSTYCPLETSPCASQWDYKDSTATKVSKTFQTSPSSCSGIQVGGTCYTLTSTNVCNIGDTYNATTQQCSHTSVSTSVPTSTPIYESGCWFATEDGGFCGSCDNGVGEGWTCTVEAGLTLSCNTGYILNGSVCTKTTTTKINTNCTNGMVPGSTLIGGDATKCYQGTSVCPVGNYSASYYACSSGILSGSNCNTQVTTSYPATENFSYITYAGSDGPLGTLNAFNLDSGGGFQSIRFNPTNMSQCWLLGSGCIDLVTNIKYTMLTQPVYRGFPQPTGIGDFSLTLSNGVTINENIGGVGYWAKAIPVDFKNYANSGWDLYMITISCDVGNADRYHYYSFRKGNYTCPNGGTLSGTNCITTTTSASPASVVPSTCNVDYSYYQYACASGANQYGKDWQVVNSGTGDCGGIGLVDTNSDGIADSCTQNLSAGNCKREKFACVANASRPCAEIGGTFQCSPYACDSNKKCGYASCPTDFGISATSEVNPLSADPLKYTLKSSICNASKCDLVDGPYYSMCGKKSCPQGFGVYEKNNSCWKDVCPSGSVEINGECIKKN